ncbi:MAG: hypothetical protein JO247_06360 [Chloroflexi bacterium]|nr:hypothetical protein [Chloroflexota bacterium]
MFVLDVGEDAGALVVYTPRALKDEEVEISFDNALPPHKVHTGVVERRLNGEPVCAAIFPSLPVGTYTLWRPSPPPQPGFTIQPGKITELDWR